jgi:DNA-binding FrmR family transcriptional regulator
MVENDRYCVDISNQVMATQSILTKANKRNLKSAYRRLRAGGV